MGIYCSTNDIVVNIVVLKDHIIEIMNILLTIIQTFKQGKLNMNYRMVY